LLYLDALHTTKKKRANISLGRDRRRAATDLASPRRRKHLQTHPVCQSLECGEVPRPPETYPLTFHSGSHHHLVFTHHSTTAPTAVAARAGATDATLATPSPLAFANTPSRPLDVGPGRFLIAHVLGACGPARAVRTLKRTPMRRHTGEQSVRCLWASRRVPKPTPGRRPGTHRPLSRIRPGA